MAQAEAKQQEEWQPVPLPPKVVVAILEFNGGECPPSGSVLLSFSNGRLLSMKIEKNQKL